MANKQKSGIDKKINKAFCLFYDRLMWPKYFKNSIIILLSMYCPLNSNQFVFCTKTFFRSNLSLGYRLIFFRLIFLVLHFIIVNIDIIFFQKKSFKDLIVFRKISFFAILESDSICLAASSFFILWQMANRKFSRSFKLMSELE